jgi:hypothetical protein
MKRAKRIATPDIATKIVAGKALRDKVPREQHGQWKSDGHQLLHSTGI